ncbi:MAG: sulfotransferase domain-containing protein [Myxococcota bacterium]
MTLPSFIIVGAAKSGTTALKEYLRAHPDVFMARMEVRYFDNEENHARDLDWYEHWFEGAKAGACVGEKSPSYCYAPKAPERMAKLLPNAKLIWLFREPVARAYSHYWHSVSRGKEPMSFEEAVRSERDRLGSNYLRGAYLSRSYYADQVERYLAHFPKSQMLFLRYEDLKTQPDEVVRQTSSFIGIPFDPGTVKSEKRVNVTRVPRSVRLEYQSRQWLGRKSRLYHLIRRFNRRRTPGYPPLSPALREELRAHFAPHNRRLEELTGLRFAW